MMDWKEVRKAELQAKAAERHDKAWASYMKAVRKAIAGNRSYSVQQALVFQSRRVASAQLELDIAEGKKWR